jgi:hypothetical protein
MDAATRAVSCRADLFDTLNSRQPKRIKHRSLRRSAACTRRAP